MSLSKNNGTKRKRLLIPGNGQMRLDPMRARITASEERTGIGVEIIEIKDIETSDISK
jgi:hypothetical protein